MVSPERRRLSKRNQGGFYVPDSKDVAQDKNAMEQKRDAGEDPAENTVHQPQPGKKPKLERDEEGNVKD